jgi:hypothetical protein
MSNQIPPYHRRDGGWPGEPELARELDTVQVDKFVAPEPVPAVDPRMAAARQAATDYDNRRKPSATVYTREQKGHSLILHLLFGWALLYIPTIYVAVSPRHFWHA